MKLYSYPLLASALCAGLVTSSAAPAPEPTEKDTQLAKSYFSKCDKNGDGLVDADEFFRGLWRGGAIDLSKFEAADDNKDGKLTGTELMKPETAAKDGKKELSFKQFFSITKTTKDKDGSFVHPFVSEANVEDYKEGVIHMWTRKSHLSFLAADADKNDKLNEEEFQKAFEERVQAAKRRMLDKYGKDGAFTRESWSQMVWDERYRSLADRASSFFDEADADADNVLTLGEYMAHGDDSAKERFESWIPQHIEDRTQIPKEMLLEHANHEFRQAAKSTFDEADTDKNEKISSDESSRADFGFEVEL